MLVHLEMLKINFIGLLQVSIALIPIVIEGIYGMNCLVCFVGETCRGALEEISMSLVFPMRPGDACFCPAIAEF